MAGKAVVRQSCMDRVYDRRSLRGVTRRALGAGLSSGKSSGVAAGTRQSTVPERQWKRLDVREPDGRAPGADGMAIDTPLAELGLGV